MRLAGEADEGATGSARRLPHPRVRDGQVAPRSHDGAKRDCSRRQPTQLEPRHYAQTRMNRPPPHVHGEEDVCHRLLPVAELPTQTKSDGKDPSRVAVTRSPLTSRRVTQPGPPMVAPSSSESQETPSPGKMRNSPFASGSAVPARTNRGIRSSGASTSTDRPPSTRVPLQ